MIVLAIEVYYFKRKALKKQEANNTKKISSLITTVQPFESYEHTKKILKQNNILLGHGDFVPAKNKQFEYPFTK